MTGNRDATLAALFEAHFEPVLAYARRRTPQRFDAEDLVAETFAVAWRRLDRLPRAPEQQLPWLYGVARRLSANRRRGAVRRLRLHGGTAIHLQCASGGSRPDVVAALAGLSEPDQELLRLISWERLTHAEAAKVLVLAARRVDGSASPSRMEQLGGLQT